MTHLQFVRVGQRSLPETIAVVLALSSEYFSSFDLSAQRRYLEKLKIDGETLPDPYAIDENL